MTELAAIGLRAGYGRRPVLAGLDLTLRSGEVVAVVGPNGAGKSTLVRAFAGLLAPTEGRVTLDGEDVRALSRRQIARRIAVVPQATETLFPFSVREIVALGRTARLGLLGTPSADDVRAVEGALAELELGPLAERRVDELSGGERQRAVLAMALAQETDVLLLDEPTVHLDPAHQRATLALVRSLAQRRGLVVAAVLHDLNLAAAMCTRMVALAEGRVARDGSPDEVLEPCTVARVFGDGLVVARHDGQPYVLPRP